MAIKIQNVLQISKVAQSWRIQTRVETLQGILHEGMATKFNHVRCQGNKVTDQLARWSV